MRFLKTFLSVFLLICSIGVLGGICTAIGWLAWLSGIVIIGLVGTVFAFALFIAAIITICDWIWDRWM